MSFCERVLQLRSRVFSGLDAAGKTTICKKLLNESIEEVSPTLGFIIKTIDYDGLVVGQSLVGANVFC